MITYDTLHAACIQNAPYRRGFQLNKHKRKHSGDNPTCSTFNSATFFFKASQTSTPAQDQIVIDMENVGTQRGKRTSFGRVYSTFNRIDLLAFMCSLHPSDSHLYESLSTQPHKLVVDIDMPLTGTQTVRICDLDRKLWSCFIPVLKFFLISNLTDQEGCAFCICDDDVLVLDASRTGYKYSKHIIINTKPYICAPSRAHERQLMLAFERHLISECAVNNELSSFCYFETPKGRRCSVDFSIYTKGKRSMRIIGSCKSTDQMSDIRTLVPSAPPQTAVRTLSVLEYFANTFGMASVIWKSKLPMQVDDRVKRQQAQNNQGATRKRTSTASTPEYILELLRYVADLVHPNYVNRNIECVDGNMVQCSVNYGMGPDGTRKCAFFGERHTRHYAVITLSVAGRIEYYCHGCRDSIVLCGGMSNDTPTGSCTTTSFKSIVASQLPGTLYNHINTRYLPSLNKVGFSSNIPSLLLIKSSMGTGKTKVVADHIHAMPAASRVLSIGFRQTLNSSLAKRFGLQDYQTAELPLYDYHRLAVQYDSIIKLLRPGSSCEQLSIKAKYDLVVIDEVESLLAHLLSDTVQHRSTPCWKVFCCVLQNSTSIMLCDADIGATAAGFAKLLADGRSSQVLHNTHSSKSRQHIFLSSSKLFLGIFTALLKQGKRIYVACNSRKFAELLHMTAATIHKSSLTVQGSSPAVLKRAMADCDTIWVKYDTVICTPAVAAGVDFSVLYFDHTMVYGTNTSNTARELNQQIGRVRVTKNDKVYVYIEDNTTTEPACTKRCEFDKASKAIELHAMHISSTICQLTGEVGVRLAPCPGPLASLLCQAAEEKEKSHAAMQSELIRVLLAAGAGDIHEMPKQRPIYMDAFKMEMAMVKIEVDRAAVLARTALLDEDAAGDTADAASYEKAIMCAYYGGADIKDADVVLALSQPSHMAHSSAMLGLLLTVKQLHMIETAQGMSMATTTFADCAGIVHSATHSLVLELKQPMWSQKLFVMTMLYAAGCQLVRVTYCGGVISAHDDGDMMWALVHSGLSDVLAVERAATCPWALEWLSSQSVIQGAKLDTKGDTAALVKSVKKHMTKEYGLRWQHKTRTGSKVQVNHTMVLMWSACLRLYNPPAASPLNHSCIDHSSILSAVNDIVSFLDASAATDPTPDAAATLWCMVNSCCFSYAAHDLQRRATHLSCLRSSTPEDNVSAVCGGWEKVAGDLMNLRRTAYAAVSMMQI